MRERGPQKVTPEMGRMGAEDPSHLLSTASWGLLKEVGERFGVQVVQIQGTAEDRRR